MQSMIKAIVTIFIAAGALGGCGRLGPQLAVTQSGYVGPDGAGDCQSSGNTGRAQTSPYCRFVRDYEASFNAFQDPTKAQALLDSGFLYAGLICNNYFNILADGNQVWNFRRETTTLAGGFLSALGGLTGTPADHIAIVNTGIAATVAGMESYQEHYYFGPNILTLRRLVSGAQANYAATVITAEVRSELNFTKAVQHIDSYQALCQVDTIQGFVDEAVSNQQVVFETSARDYLLNDLSLQPALDELADTLDAVDNIHVSQLSVLAYIRQYGLPQEQNIRDEVIRPVLGLALYNELSDTDGDTPRLRDPDAFRSSIDAALELLDAQARSKVNRRVQAMRQLILTLAAPERAEMSVREELSLLLLLASSPLDEAQQSAPQAVLSNR